MGLIAENSKVKQHFGSQIQLYNSGYKKGYAAGNAAGYDAAEKDIISPYAKLQNIYDINSAIGGTDTTTFPTVTLENWDSCWDSWQAGGTKTDYQSTALRLNKNSFAGWQSEYIIPKYPIVPTAAWAMFYKCVNLIEAPELDLSSITDWVISGAYGCNNLFDQCHKLKRVGVLDVSTTSLRGAFSECYELETIEELKVNNTFFKNTFSACYKLKEIRFVGTLTARRDMQDYEQNGTTALEYGTQWNLDLSAATELSKESIISLFNCTNYDNGYIYDNYGTAVNSATIVLSLAAVNKAFETSAGANDGVNSIEWAETIQNAWSYYIVLR